MSTNYFFNTLAEILEGDRAYKVVDDEGNPHVVVLFRVVSITGETQSKYKQVSEGNHEVEAEYYTMKIRYENDVEYIRFLDKAKRDREVNKIYKMLNYKGKE